MAWTVAENMLLEQLVKENSDIVTMQEKLGKTNDAIRHKLKRMGVIVAAPPKPVKEKQPRQKKVAVEQDNVAVKPARKTKPRPIIPMLNPPKLHPIEQIGPRGCHWPIGDLRQGDFHFCGADRQGSGPYCANHAKIAFNGAGNPKVPQQAQGD